MLHWNTCSLGNCWAIVFARYRPRPNKLVSIGGLGLNSQSQIFGASGDLVAWVGQMRWLGGSTEDGPAQSAPEAIWKPAGPLGPSSDLYRSKKSLCERCCCFSPSSCPEIPSGLAIRLLLHYVPPTPTPAFLDCFFLFLCIQESFPLAARLSALTVEEINSPA